MDKNVDYDGCASHIPLLTNVVMNTNGSILELGCGFYSTPLLHALCQKNQRSVTSLDNDQEWVDQFARYRTNWHTVDYVDWSVWSNNIQTHYNVVFLDLGPPATREYVFERIKDKSDFILIHDSDSSAYHYDFSSFQYKFEYNIYRPQTTIVSNYDLNLVGVQDL